MDKAREMMVYKHNDLVQKTRHELSMAQQKAMIYICSLIKPNSDELEYTFDIAEYIKVCGMAKSGKTYEEIKRTLGELRDKGWWLPPDEKGNEPRVSWLNKVVTNQKSGKVKIRLDEDLAPFLLHIKEQTTRYELFYILPLSSGYAIQLYELLKSYAWTGQWLVSIDEFKFRLMLEKNPSYNSWGKVKEKVVDVALKQINEFTDLHVLYKDNGGRGKKATKIAFVINFKEKDEQQKAIENIEAFLSAAEQEVSATDELYDFLNTNKKPATRKRKKEQPQSEDTDELIPGQSTIDDYLGELEQPKSSAYTEYEECTDLVRERIEYDIFKERYPHERGKIDEIVSVMVDVLLTKKATIRVDGDEKDAEVVKERFLEINFHHLEYIFESLDRTTSDIRNIKSYLITAIYNAPMTMDSYYDARVKHDMPWLAKG